MLKVMIGSDPELFLKDGNGKIISAIGKIGGTKKRPKPVKDLGRGFAIQEDNVLVEYNTPPVRKTEDWVYCHNTMLDWLQRKVGQLGLSLDIRSSHSMDEDQMDSPRAWVFGCEPDFDVWKLEMNPKPMAKDKFLRSAGGHIHIGYDNPSPSTSIKIVRALDMYVGAWLAQKDPDVRRRELYGRAGACRFKPYGVEYRTPSNFWLSTEALMKEVYERTMKAVNNKDFVDADLCRQAADFINGDTDKTDWVINNKEVSSDINSIMFSLDQYKEIMPGG